MLRARPARARAALSALALAVSLVASASGCMRRDAELRQAPGAATASLVSARSVEGQARRESGASLPDTPGHEAEPGAARAPLSRWELWAAWNALKGDPYELDGVDRFLEEGRSLACDPKTLVRYTGTRLKYQGAVHVNAAFRERLSRFEEVVAEVAKEVYGRAPRRVLHLGAYSCRSTRKRAYRVSEHALGNAIDVAGFDFGPASKKEPLADGLPRSLRGAFQVKVKAHWTDRRGNAASAAHARFLSELATRLSDRDDVFRGMIGPSRPDHSDHFHLDMSPWRYVRF